MDSKRPEQVHHSEHYEPQGISRQDVQSADNGADRALAMIGSQRMEISEEENRRILRKTDGVILALLVWVYFLQVLDKSVLGYGATYGLKEDTSLSAGQYSLLGSIAPIAQLVWQPFSSVLIVKVPHRILMPVLCLGWGIAQTSMAACHNFSGLMAARFFLGLFEEQPIRVAAWYGTNGAATIVAAAISYGLGRINSPVLREWQIIFLFVGLLTTASVPFIYWKLDNDVLSARFLTPEEKPKAIERLRANQTGTGNQKFKWKHAVEAALEPKTYLWFGMTLALNVGASVTNTFGPLIIEGLGFDKYKASLLSMPFGALQTILILLASSLAQKAKLKGAVLAVFTLPVLAGLAVLYRAPRDSSGQGALLAGYYLLAFLFAGNPLIVSWIVGNTAGTTKKSIIMSVYNAASSVGNILGPILFDDGDAPAYKPGLRACLGVFSALIGVIAIQWANLIFLNKMQAKARVHHGKQAEVIDRSMQDHYHTARHHGDRVLQDTEGAGEKGGHLGQNAILDLTDRENDEFVYIY
ncbi:mfs transporter [Trichoderma cornu-damae]|uniref:Mfs transporter n=1 Tax=Trichoderma cornu-damae TaxID=654480 RepID=A0A9P8QYT9_9HYPO|nr:mfs transporter [Trichoderma cornu-damae]